MLFKDRLTSKVNNRKKFEFYYYSCGVDKVKNVINKTIRRGECNGKYSNRFILWNWWAN